MGSPRTPRTPQKTLFRLRLPWDCHKRIPKMTQDAHKFPPQGPYENFSVIMSEFDKRSAREILAEQQQMQQYLDSVYSVTAPPAFLAEVFAETPHKKRRFGA